MQFKLLDEVEILDRLGPAQQTLLMDFRDYLKDTRRFFHGDKDVTITEAYNSAWKLGFVDFEDGAMPNLYNIDFSEKHSSYTKLCKVGLDSKAQLEWFIEFNGEIELPTHPSFWAK